MSEQNGTTVKTKTITFNNSNTMNVMVVLIPFNCLFDINVGLIKLINLEYNDPRVFDKNTLDSLNTNFKVTKFVFDSTSENILMDILIDKDIEVAKEYYSQFIAERYQDILNLSVYTGLVKLLENIITQPDIKVSIFCLNEYEADFIHNNLSKDIHTVLPEELLDHINMYKQFYFRSSVNDPYLDTIYQYLSKVFVYILDYRINFDSEGKFIETEKVDDMRKRLVAFNLINTYQEPFYNYNEIQGDNNEN